MRRHERVDVVQTCNPPDLLFLVALALRPTGAGFVFDHHDMFPEMFLSRFPGAGRILYWLTRIAERLTFASATAAISTNESYRRVAIERGRCPPTGWSSSGSAPDIGRFVRRDPDDSLRVAASRTCWPTWA